MKQIQNESSLYSYMGKNGPEAKKSKSNYISWLRFIDGEIISLDSITSEVDVEQAISKIRDGVEQRNIYKKESDVSNFKAALNKYLKFKNDTVVEDELSCDISELLNRINKTDQLQIILSRIGQGKYREELIEYWQACSVTRCSTIEILIGSHIKPWKDSDETERCDKYNGLLLLPTLDKLFDRGYITFSDDGHIILSDIISIKEYEIMGVTRNMKIDKLVKKHSFYLDYHRKNVFLK